MTSLTRLPQDLEGTGKRSWGDLEGSGLRRVCVALADFVPGSRVLSPPKSRIGGEAFQQASMKLVGGACSA